MQSISKGITMICLLAMFFSSDIFCLVSVFSLALQWQLLDRELFEVVKQMSVIGFTIVPTNSDA